MQDLAARVVADPDWLPHSYDQDGAAIQFVRVSAEQRQVLPFLGASELASGFEKATVPIRLVERRLQGQTPIPVHFIFHTAFCCSTLLLNALDKVDGVSGLKEPAVFLNLLGQLERGEDIAGSGRLDLVLRLLGRPSPGLGAVVVKPACFASALLPHVMAAAPDARAVLLYSDLRTFLLSVAKRGLRGRTWGRQVYASCQRHVPLPLHYSAAETLGQTDLQIAGLGWLMRRCYFERAAAHFGPGRAMLLDTGAFLASPQASLESVAGFLQLGAARRTLAAIAGGPAFTRHSKEQRSFGPRERERELDEVRAAFGEEVEMVARWIEDVATFHGMGELSAPRRAGGPRVA
jgi:hypothetical protein